MEIREFRIKVPGVGRYNIYPIGDLQKDAPGFDEALFEQLKEEIAADTFPIIIGMGDYEDNFRPKVRMKIDTMTSDDKDFRNVMDDEARRRLDEITEFIAPVFNPKRGICLGLLNGHHLYEFADGVNSVQKMCGTFKTQYLDEMAYIRLVFEGAPPLSGRHGGHKWDVLIHAQHGAGGASFTGPDTANLERKTVPFWEADLYLRGHSTKRWAFPLLEYRMSRQFPAYLIKKTKWAVNTGGFMRGHLQGESTYVSRRNLPPASLGYAVCTVGLKEHRPEVARKNAVPMNEAHISVTLR